MAVNYVISLGIHGMTSYFCKLAGLKDFCCPFDWILSSPELIIDCLKDNFSSFLNWNLYIDYPGNPKACGHAKYGNLFPYHNPRTQDDYVYFARSVDRFRKCMSSNKKKMFLLIYGFETVLTKGHLQTWIQFNKILKQYTSNFILVIIIPNLNPNKDTEPLYINDNLYVYVFHSKSKSNGQHYSDQTDNRRMIKFLTSITNYDLLPLP